ncbi:elongator complex protein 4 [Nematocida sp. LUAm3]|nr:elongator complex protein 4 [Nematocida sp. LUAm3]KAI5174115.1 elongator complex protein 4 [Nematocida sp. LUAm2]KAI5177142.1 elongator complex protein 4 [Nematocida sp. LUAm1]
MFKRLIKGRKEKRGTGSQEIDRILNGGVKPGEICLLEQGEDVSYHLGIHRLFLSEGLEEEEKTLHLSPDYPRISPPSRTLEVLRPLEPLQDEKIAWRYKNMSRTQSSLQIGTSALSHSKTYDLKQVHRKSEEIEWIEYSSPKQSIQLALEKLPEGGRLSILSGFSPIWNCSQEDLSELLFLLRRGIRLKKAICLISIPVFLWSTFCYAYFDHVLLLEKNLIPSIKCDGLISCLKSEYVLPEKYAVTCKSTGICIEKVVLPPE